MDEPHYLLVLLKRLSKLSTMKVYFQYHYNRLNLSSFEEDARKSNTLFRSNSKDEEW
jgi:hypothetical protein